MILSSHCSDHTHRTQILGSKRLIKNGGGGGGGFSSAVVDEVSRENVNNTRIGTVSLHLRYEKLDT